MERFGWLRRYISPVFLALLVASFILWYICVVEGVGTNLFGYRVYMSKRLRIPLSELKFRSVKAEDGEKFLKIDSLSLHNAISVRLSDIKVISVGSVPEIPDPRQQEK